MSQHDASKTAETFVHELLGLPEEIKVLSIVGVGHPAETKPPVPASTLQFDKIKYNRWA